MLADLPRTLEEDLVEVLVRDKLRRERWRWRGREGERGGRKEGKMEMERERERERESVCKRKGEDKGLCFNTNTARHDPTLNSGGVY